MIKRKITNKGLNQPLEDQNGTPLSGVSVEFLLVYENRLPAATSDRFTQEFIIGRKETTTTTIAGPGQPAGEIEIDLWPTSRGSEPVFWLCQIPSRGIVFMAPLEDGEDPISWIDFRLSGSMLAASTLGNGGFIGHLQDGSKHLSPAQNAALDAANEPSAENPLATMSDVEFAGGHLHENKAVLDQFAETDGQPTYAGFPIIGQPGEDGQPGADSTVPGPPGMDSVVPGPPGENGLSAYEIAVVNGFVGNEAEWLASLEGAGGLPAPPDQTNNYALVSIAGEQQWFQLVEVGGPGATDGTAAATGAELTIESGQAAGTGSGQNAATGEELALETGVATGSATGPGEAAATGVELALEPGQATASGSATQAATGVELSLETGTATGAVSSPGQAAATGVELGIETGTAAGTGSGNAAATGEEHAIETGSATGSGEASILYVNTTFDTVLSPFTGTGWTINAGKAFASAGWMQAPIAVNRSTAGFYIDTTISLAAGMSAVIYIETATRTEETDLAKSSYQVVVSNWEDEGTYGYALILNKGDAAGTLTQIGDWFVDTGNITSDQLIRIEFTDTTITVKQGGTTRISAVADTTFMSFVQLAYQNASGGGNIFVNSVAMGEL